MLIKPTARRNQEWRKEVVKIDWIELNRLQYMNLALDAEYTAAL